MGDVVGSKETVHNLPNLNYLEEMELSYEKHLQPQGKGKKVQLCKSLSVAHLTSNKLLPSIAVQTESIHLLNLLLVCFTEFSVNQTSNSFGR